MNTSATTSIHTEKASGYLQQICKHFGHKIPVEFDANSGRITFDFGTAELSAAQSVLGMTARADSQDDLERLKNVLTSHLERFAFREDLNITWD